jgi:hypothetical protein
MRKCGKSKKMEKIIILIFYGKHPNWALFLERVGHRYPGPRLEKSHDIIIHC